MNKINAEFKRLKGKINLANVLLVYLIICPILDVSSFLFRQYIGSFFSISTILRPIIPICAIVYIFFKDKIKIPMIIVGSLYAIYAIVHLFVFNELITNIAYGNILRELQYLVNYTFMIMNLFLYIYVFLYKTHKQYRKMYIEKLKKVLLITFSIYIALMYIAILTGTSSYTYTEDKMGLKGWFESGNSIGTLMIICLFLVIPMMEKENSEKTKIVATIDVILAGAYLTFLLGTRTGLFGFLIVIITFFCLKGLYALFHNEKLNKKILLIGGIILTLMIISLIIFGSNTLKRRNLLTNREAEMYDEYIKENAHVTGDLVKIANEIKQNKISEEYISKDMQKAIIDLYNYCNKHKVSNTNMRIIQLVYHIALQFEQKNIFLILFGNGYMLHYYELIFEMEVPAFIFNFGLIGFLLYFIPFLAIAILMAIKLFKKLKIIKVYNIMNVCAIWFAIIISTLAGYTFFNSSTITIITVICVILLYDFDFREEKNVN